MKLPLHVLVLTALVGPPSDAFTPSSSCQNAPTGSCSSAFTGQGRSPRSRMSRRNYSRGDMLMYDSRSDPPNDQNKPTGSAGGAGNVWTALANTERWISDTLAAASPGQPEGSNPYARKEVSYVCETSDEIAMIVGGLFRRLREAREVGETHGEAEEQRLVDRGSGHSQSPSTFRQTQVVVIPSSEELSSFHAFDNLVQAINHARRRARDYVTEVAAEKSERDLRDWVVSVNCAHLHPKYGEQTAEELMAEMKKEEAEGEVDMNLKAYKEMRLKARQSPYPTLVLEVRATPPPDFGDQEPPESPPEADADDVNDVTSEDVKKLEALFGMSAASKSSGASDDAFYDALGKAVGEVSFITPLGMAQNWISENDPLFDEATSIFTTSDTTYVDAAYEFVFHNIAMHRSTAKSLNDAPNSSDSRRRSYLVMPNFLPASATSLEKFSREVSNIIDAIPVLGSKVSVSTMHPEHIEEAKRSPGPVIVLEWS